jgi:hypothetical protein
VDGDLVAREIGLLRKRYAALQALVVARFCMHGLRVRCQVETLVERERALVARKHFNLLVDGPVVRVRVRLLRERRIASGIRTGMTLRAPSIRTVDRRHPIRLVVVLRVGARPRQRERRRWRTGMRGVRGRW